MTYTQEQKQKVLKAARELELAIDQLPTLSMPSELKHITEDTRALCITLQNHMEGWKARL